MIHNDLYESKGTCIIWFQQIKNPHLLNILWHHVLELLLQGRIFRKHRMISYQLTADKHTTLHRQL